MKKLILFSMAVLYAAAAFSQLPKNISSTKSQNRHLNSKPLIAEKFNCKSAAFFVENKGQLKDENGKQKKDIKFYYSDGKVNVYCGSGKISFVFLKEEYDAANGTSEATGSPVETHCNASLHSRQQMAHQSKISTSRLDFMLLNSNQASQIIGNDQQPYFENFYFNNTSNNGITDVHTYKTVTYKNIYPDIDLLLTTTLHGIEYSFLVHPGGKVSDIKMQWNGSNKKDFVTNVGIKHTSNFANLDESLPKSFTDGKTIKSSFCKKGNLFGFQVGKYDHKRNLLIDPSITWGTYFGGPNNEQSLSISNDGKGNEYIAGFTNSHTGIATSGAFATTFAGGISDAYLAKFNSSGMLLWSTYFGGTNTDQANSVCNDASGNIYITGYTNSSGIATSGAYQTSMAGFNDVLIAKFTSTGSLSWATYYGGSGNDQANGITADTKGNLFVTGYTSSKSNFATSGAFQTSFGGTSDAFLAKFTNAGNLTWATYYGGTGGDFTQAVCCDTAGDAYITGFTNSNNGIAVSGAYQSVNGGSYDVFLAKFSASGSEAWATYYGGGGYDVGYGITTDTIGNVYITGETGSFDSIATKGAYQTVNPQVPNSPLTLEYDAFLTKFTSSGKIVWGTFFGGMFSEIGYALCTDKLGNVFVSGYAESMSGVATTGAYQTSNMGGGLTRPYYGGDAFLANFNVAGNLKWATYYGGTGFDQGNGVCTDASENVYIAGYTASASSIATSGAYQSSYSGANDSYLAKFRYKPYPDDAGIDTIKSPSDTLCESNQPVKVHLKNYGRNPLTTVDIKWSVNGNAQPTYKWKGKLVEQDTITVNLGKFDFFYGPNTIVAGTANPNGKTDSVKENDNVQKIISVNALPLAYVGINSTICFGSSTTLGSTKIIGDKYSWTSNPTGFVSLLSNPAVKPKITTTYILTDIITATGCKRTDSVKITVDMLPSARWTVSNVLQHYLFKANDTVLSKTSYAWTYGDGSKSDTGYHVAHVFPGNKIYLVKLKVEDSFGCASEKDSMLNVTISGIEPERGKNLKINVFPNPFQSTTTISYNLDKKSNIKICLYDITGKQVSTFNNEPQNPGTYQLEIDATKYKLEKGIYFLKFENENQIISYKLIKF